MAFRTRILLDGVEIDDITQNAAFTLGGIDYPRNWFKRDGTLPTGYTVEDYEVVKQPPTVETEWTVWYIVILDRLSDNDANALDNYVERLDAKVKVRIKAFGVENNDVDFRTKLSQLGADPDVVLAP